VFLQVYRWFIISSVGALRERDFQVLNTIADTIRSYRCID